MSARLKTVESFFFSVSSSFWGKYLSTFVASRRFHTSLRRLMFFSASCDRSSRDVASRSHRDCRDSSSPIRVRAIASRLFHRSETTRNKKQKTHKERRAKTVRLRIFGCLGIVQVTSQTRLSPGRLQAFLQPPRRLRFNDEK